MKLPTSPVFLPFLYVHPLLSSFLAIYPAFWLTLHGHYCTQSQFSVYRSVCCLCCIHATPTCSIALLLRFPSSMNSDLLWMGPANEMLIHSLLVCTLSWDGHVLSRLVKRFGIVLECAVCSMFSVNVDTTPLFNMKYILKCLLTAT